MNRIFKTIAKDIIVLSAQAVAFRLAASEDQQQDIVFAAVPTKGMPQAKAITARMPPRRSVSASETSCDKKKVADLCNGLHYWCERAAGSTPAPG